MALLEKDDMNHGLGQRIHKRHEPAGMAPPIASVESAEASMYAFSEMVKRAFRRAKPCRSVESKRHAVNALLYLQYDTGF